LLVSRQGATAKIAVAPILLHNTIYRVIILHAVLSEARN